MAEKKRPSVAEILAAARKADGGGGASKPAAEPAPKPQEEAAAPAASEPVAELPAAPAAEAPAPAEKTTPAAKPAAGGPRPSVAEMMAMARAKPAAEKAAPAEKPAAKASPKAAPVKEKAPEPVVSGEKETASILAAARTGAKPGPMTKAEAAKVAPEKPAKAAATKLAVPPMPVKPEYAKPKAKKDEAADEDRRWFLSVVLGSFLATGFAAMATTFTLWTLGFARFMFPNILTEPPSKFKVGFPAEFPPGSVEEKYKALYGVWVVNTEYKGKQEIFALRTVCTHLGCTPNWLEGEQKFKCPCHGSGFYKDGINFEGPAPRPLERYAIRLADDGQLEVDKSKLFLEEKGQWVDAASFFPV